MQRKRFHHLLTKHKPEGLAVYVHKCQQVQTHTRTLSSHTGNVDSDKWKMRGKVNAMKESPNPALKSAVCLEKHYTSPSHKIHN